LCPSKLPMVVFPIAAWCDLFGRIPMLNHLAVRRSEQIITRGGHAPDDDLWIQPLGWEKVDRLGGRNRLDISRFKVEQLDAF